MSHPTGTPAIEPAVFPFEHDHRGNYRDVADVVGGKGASLWALTRMGIPVPPGFSIGTAACRSFLRDGMSDSLRAAIREHLRSIETRLGRRFGDADRPLLLSVRSGSPISMPGMMDTVLNVGLTPAAVEGLARETGDRAFAVASHERFLAMFGTIVLGLRASDVTADAIRVAHPASLDDAFVQLELSIEAVFRSWHGARAVAYREREGIPHDLGTAVNVQAMVFGNRDDRSGTGVVFTRDPSTGEPKPRGDFLFRAQGEDVVAGTHRTLSLDEFARAFPDLDVELRAIMDRLERYYRDMCDIEFTIESGRLWVLQSRVGKRAPAAAARIAVDLARDARFGISQRDAVAMVPRTLLAEGATGRRRSGAGSPIASGIAASPGVATGRLVFDPDRAIDFDARGEAVVLARRETSPADVHGMSVATAIVTAYGGEMSHAAVVAREWGIPAVCGVAAIAFSDGRMSIGDTIFVEGDVVSVDGTTGDIFLGTVDAVVDADPYVAILQGWAASA